MVDNLDPADLVSQAKGKVPYDRDLPKFISFKIR